jgi:sugar phosphate isomerase/epimerase
VNAKNLCLDTAHVWLSGDKNVDHIYELAKRAKLIHFNGLKGETK